MQWLGISKYIIFLILLKFQKSTKPTKCINKIIMKIFIQMFPMIFQSSMGLGKSRCDVPNNAIQRWACPRAIG
jgi:hypothetical protein